jgi:multidrug resistance efflux pump
LQPVPTAASVAADHAIEVTIPRSEFAGQVGEVGVKVGAAIVTGWKDPLAVPVQDEQSDSGQPPLKV